MRRIRKQASGLTLTKGQIFTVYYYPEGTKIPKDSLTRAKGLHEACTVIDNPIYARPRYAGMRETSDGSAHFFECNEKKPNGLCEPEQPLTKKKWRL